MNIEIKRDGLVLRGLYEKVSDHLVILSHGFSANYHYYDEVAPWLNNLGFSTIRYDFNGHGTSDGKQEDMTVLNEISDLMAVVNYARDLGYKDIILFGQSQGGVVSSMTAGYMHDLVSKLILWAPAATLKDDAIKGSCMGKQYDPDHLPDLVDVGFFKVGGNYFRVAQTLPIYEVACKFTNPVLIVHGTADMVVNKIASERYKDVYKNCTLKIVEGEDHNITTHRDLALQYVQEFLTK